MMGSIFSVKMSYSEKMCALEELTTITDDPSESNKNCSEDYTLEEIIWNTLSFEIVLKKKGLFLVCPLGGLFLAFQLGLLEFGFSLLILHFCLAGSVVGTFSHLILNFIILESLCKNTPQNIRMIDEAKKR